MLFFWIALIIEAVVLVVSVIVYSKEKKWFALFLLFADLAAISYTYFSGNMCFSDIPAYKPQRNLLPGMPE